MSSAARHSGLQKEVLALYRVALRAARAKPPGQRESTAEYIRSEFRFQVRARARRPTAAAARHAAPPQARDVARSDIQRIEYLIRKGKKQLKLLSSEQAGSVVVATPR